jgi:hypothetical protein
MTKEINVQEVPPILKRRKITANTKKPTKNSPGPGKKINDIKTNFGFVSF